MTDDVALAFREGWGRLVAGLIGWCGDWDLAEECAAEAFAAAVEAWPRDGEPDRPLAWLTTVARNRARDRIRRRTTQSARHEALAPLLDETSQSPGDAAGDAADIPDDRLRLIFTCCHPALPEPARIALTLRTLCGLTNAEIGRAFLVTEATMDKRLVRARAKIKQAAIPYRIPPADVLPERLDGVLAVVYLLFNEGYAASSGEAFLRVDLSAEAIRLARLIHELMPTEAETAGLLALLLLTDARRRARLRDGEIVPLPEQDRSLWNADQTAEAEVLLRATGGPIGPYAVQARIALCHNRSADPGQTDWAAIAALYTLLPTTAVTELNRAVAVAMADGPAAGLAIAGPLEPDLAAYHLFHATLADLHTRLDHPDQAQECLRRAIDLAPTPAERRLLRRRLSAVPPGMGE
ncbi:MAG: sigma-70 family RNA polymerase sigma factor [Nostocoides sp.]